MSEDSSKSRKKNPYFPAKWPGVQWDPLPAILVTVLAFLGAQFFAAAILGLVFGMTAAEWLAGVKQQFLFAFISDVLIVLAIWLFLRERKVDIRKLGFTRGPAWSDLAYAGAGYLAYLVLWSAVAYLFIIPFTNIDLGQRQELGFDMLFSQADIILAFVALVVLPPLVEETVFRGFVFAGLRKKLTFAWATIITSLLFAGPHLLASSQGLLWIAGIDTLILSLALCYLRERTGSLWAPIALHGFKNGLAFWILLSPMAALI